MRNVIVNEWMSFDGVVQSAGADDDTSNGFAHGGWHIPTRSEIPAVGRRRLRQGRGIPVRPPHL